MHTIIFVFPSGRRTLRMWGERIRERAAKLARETGASSYSIVAEVS
jgi:hypothetical protein